MNNVKLTLATTLSALALTFAGAASADNGKRFDNQKQKNQVSYSKKVNKQQINNKRVSKTVVKTNTRNVQRTTQNTKKVVVKDFFAANKAAKNGATKKITPKKVVVTKTVVKKPAKPVFVSKSQYNTKKVVNHNAKRNVKRSVNKNVRSHSYTVRPGDTLYRISLRTGVSVNKIAKLNRITNWNMNNIRVGQVLRIS